MTDPIDKATVVPPSFPASLEPPALGERIYDQAIPLSGWVHAPGRDPASCRIRASLDGGRLAETRIFFRRPDICEHFALSPETLSGFRMLGKLSPPATEAREATLRVVASWGDEIPSTLVERQVRIVPSLLQERPHGKGDTSLLSDIEGGGNLSKHVSVGLLTRDLIRDAAPKS